LAHYQKATIIKPSEFKYQLSYANALQADKQHQKAILFIKPLNVSILKRRDAFEYGANYAHFEQSQVSSWMHIPEQLV
jgi:hypothetical protein